MGVRVKAFAFSYFGFGAWGLRVDPFGFFSGWAGGRGSRRYLRGYLIRIRLPSASPL